MKKRGKLAPTLLCLFLGPLGIHDFYAGKTVSGIIHLALVVATIWFIVFGPFIAYGMEFIGYAAAAINGVFTLVEFLVLLISPTYGNCEGW